MTFFLPAPAAEDATTSAPAYRPEPEVNPAPVADAGFFDVVGAGFTAEAIETDRWMRRDGVRRALADELKAALPDSFTAPRRAAAPPVPDRRRGRPRDPRGSLQIGTTLDDIAAAALELPERFSSMPQSPEQFEAEVSRRLNAERDEALNTLGMGGTGAGLAEFAGRGGAAMTDETSLLMLPLGGASGGILRTIGREAALGALGEALVLPKMYQVAADLDIDAPDWQSQIGMGFLFGGAIGGGMSGISRAISYASGRSAQADVTAPADQSDPLQHRANIDAAARALEEGRPVSAALSAGAADDLAAYVRQIERIESGGKADAKNPNSSAAGALQFTEKTWLSVIEDRRPDLKQGRSRSEILNLRNDPDLSREMGGYLAQENVAAMQAKGIDVDAGAVYLAHFAGEPTASRVMVAGEDQPIASILSAEQMTANASIRWAGKLFADFTVGDMRRWADAKMSGLPDPARAFKSSSRRGYTAPDQVVTSAGRRIDVTYEVVDLDSLNLASGALQPRDRSRAASDEQIAQIAAELDPARLMPSPEADRGSPIVGPDGIVESGNGRVRALARAAEEVPDRYQAYVETIREQFDIPEGVNRPVLIARRTSDLSDQDRVAMVQEANQSTIARMSGTEQARTDAAGLTRDVLDSYDPDQGVLSAANVPFVTRFLASLPQAERAALVTRTGQLNAEGARRLQAALFSRAYDATDLTESLTETASPEARVMIRTLADIAPEWAAFRDDIAAGDILPEMDITPQMLDALRLIAAARREAAKGDVTVQSAIADAVAQSSLFGTDPMVEMMVRVFHADGRARGEADVASILKSYIREARSVGSADASLFGDTLSSGPEEIVNAIVRDAAADPSIPAAAPVSTSARTPVSPRAGAGAGDPVAPPRFQTGPGPEFRRVPGDEARPAGVAPAPPPIRLAAIRDEDFTKGAEAAASIAANLRATEALRADIEALGDFTFRDAANTEFSARELLDDLDADDEFDGVLSVCATAGRTG